MQGLISDGGSASAGDNYSGPTRYGWHSRLGLAWRRQYNGSHPAHGLGNWLDARLTAEGSLPFARSEPITDVGQVVQVALTPLVQRWLTLGADHSVHLLGSTANSLWPVLFFGRGDATAAHRPQLTVVTSAGTAVLFAKANAAWHRSSFLASGSAFQWRLAAGESAAVLRFDLSTISGVLQSATLSFKVKGFPDGGGRGQVVEVFDSDPPTINSPEAVATPKLGLAAGFPNFAALKNSAHPDLVFASDFAEPGPLAGGFSPPATRQVNPATGTTYAKGTIAEGAFDSADLRKSVSVGTIPRGTPNVVHPELFGQYWLYLDDDFGTTAATSVKMPSMGVQFGWWNPVGYWQSTTGNGGYVGTGLKVDNGGNSAFEYQGHSVRFLTGVAPVAGDDDPYVGWFGMSIYAYHLDQGGPYPPADAFPNVVIRRGQWYCIDMRVKQNSMSGTQDAIGNYATANPDGIYQVWINGMQVYLRSDYRWRRHAEFGVQGIWLDVYHGGTVPSPRTMHYRLDRVVLARRYVGPPAP